MQEKPLPLMFEDATPRARRAIVRNILNACEAGERAFLVDSPWALDIRAESVLADNAPEWFAQTGSSSAADRIALSTLAADALPDSKPGRIAA